MGNFICATCGKEVNIYEAVVSWRRQDDALTDFTITHRSDRPPGHNACRDVYRVASVNGYLAFVQYLLTRWGEGYVIDRSLMQTMELLSEHINDRLYCLLDE